MISFIRLLQVNRIVIVYALILVLLPRTPYVNVTAGKIKKAEAWGEVGDVVHDNTTVEGCTQTRLAKHMTFTVTLHKGPGWGGGQAFQPLFAKIWNQFVRLCKHWSCWGFAQSPLPGRSPPISSTPSEYLLRKGRRHRKLLCQVIVCYQYVLLAYCLNVYIGLFLFALLLFRCI